jgi:hypothetical protein
MPSTLVSAALWELLWIGISILIVYAVARWKGDALLEKAAEHRRLQEWSQVSKIVAFRIQLAILRGAWVPGYQAGLPAKSSDVADSGGLKQ